MSKVVRLFGHGQVENSAHPETIAMANFVAVVAELVRVIKELSKHLDSIDDLIDPISDPEAQKHQDQLRKASAFAVRNLSQAIGKVPILHLDALLESEQSRRPLARHSGEA